MINLSVACTRLLVVPGLAYLDGLLRPNWRSCGVLLLLQSVDLLLQQVQLLLWRNGSGSPAVLYHMAGPTPRPVLACPMHLSLL